MKVIFKFNNDGVKILPVLDDFDVLLYPRGSWYMYHIFSIKMKDNYGTAKWNSVT